MARIKQQVLFEDMTLTERNVKVVAAGIGWIQLKQERVLGLRPSLLSTHFLL